MPKGEPCLPPVEDFPEDPDPIDLQGYPTPNWEKAGWENYWGKIHQDYFNKQIKEQYA